MASSTLSIRVPEETRSWLEGKGRHMGTPGSVAARLLEEARRRDRFRGIEFRDTPEGRFAFLSETRLAVHFVKQTASDFGGEAIKVAAHFAQPVWKIESALGYAETFSEEIEKASARVAGLESFEELKAKLPHIELLDLNEG
ncbi:MAG: hypothetical protein ACI9R3_004882 [Verrucomicrobiales bacterium]|jgi:hypothetical protein